MQINELMNTCILFSLLHIKYAQNLLFIIDQIMYSAKQHKNILCICYTVVFKLIDYYVTSIYCSI